jgi:hypothetical protein
MAYFFFSCLRFSCEIYFLKEGKPSAVLRSLDGASFSRGPPQLRFSLSHSRPEFATLDRTGPIGRRALPKQSSVSVHFVCEIRLWAMAGGVNKLTMRSMTGSRSAGGSADPATRHSPSCRSSHRPTRITAWWPGAKRWSGASLITVHGKRRPRR